MQQSKLDPDGRIVDRTWDVKISNLEETFPLVCQVRTLELLARASGSRPAAAVDGLKVSIAVVVELGRRHEGCNLIVLGIWPDRVAVCVPVGGGQEHWYLVQKSNDVWCVATKVLILPQGIPDEWTDIDAWNRHRLGLVYKFVASVIALNCFMV